VAKYLGQRLLHTLPVLLGVTLAAFLLIHLVPGDPVRIMLGSRASPAAVSEVRKQFALDRPLPVQYLDFLRGAITFNFGESVAQRTPVSSLIGKDALASLLLMSMSLLIAVIVAMPLGIVSAIRRNRPTDHLIRVVSMITFAMPPFWLGLILILVFALNLGWFPTSGYGGDFGEHLQTLVLPSVTLGLWLAPLFLRTLRSSMIENMDAEFTESARARGLRERRVIGHHVLSNSLIAMVTVVGISVGALLGASVIVENVFAIPGLGALLVQAVLARDFAVIQALTLIFGVLVIFTNLLTDLAYAWLDPRVRL